VITERSRLVDGNPRADPPLWAGWQSVTSGCQYSQMDRYGADHIWPLDRRHLFTAAVPLPIRLCRPQDVFIAVKRQGA